MARTSAYALAAADILREQGRIRAAAEMTKAAAYGNLARSIPANVQGLVDRREQRQEAGEQRHIRDLQRRGAELNLQRTTDDFGRENAVRDVIARTPRGEGNAPNYEQISRELMAIDPERAVQMQAIGDAQTARVERATQKRAQDVARILGEAVDEASWTTARGALEQQGLPLDGLPETWSPEAKKFRDDSIQRAMTFDSWLNLKFAKEKVPTREIKTKNADGSETTRIVADVAGQTFTSAAEPKALTFPRGPETRMVDGKRRDVVMASDGNWYIPGDTKTALDPKRVLPEPPKVTTDPNSGITPSMKQQAERTKATRLLALEEAFRVSKNPQADVSGISSDAQAILAALTTTSGGQRVPMTLGDLDNRKLMIENAFRAELGLRPVVTLSESGYTPSQPGQAAPPRPGPAAAPGLLPSHAPAGAPKAESLVTPRLPSGQSPVVTVGGRKGRFNFNVPPETGGTPAPRYAFDTEDGGRWFFQLETDLQGGRWEAAEHAQADFERYKKLDPATRTATMRAMWGEAPIASIIDGAASEGVSFAELKRRLTKQNTHRQISDGEPTPVAASPAPTPAAAGKVSVGSQVMYQGKRYKVVGIDANGQASLAPLP